MWARKPWIVFAILLIVAASFRVFVAHHWPNDGPDDGRVYAQIARNLLEQHSFSDSGEPPYSPTLIRLPGYPLFLAAIYKIFGHGNNGAVRIVQALIDTGTCALIALLASYWQPDPERKRASASAALALAAVCPFTTIYAAAILTEVPTTFLALAMCVAATLAFRKASTTEDTEEDKRRKFRQSLVWWVVAGVLGGLNVLFRPDSGLFVAALGITLVATGLGPLVFGLRQKPKTQDQRPQFKRDGVAVILSGIILSLTFLLVLVPWTIRNARVFHLFQPLAPPHGEMPGEFVPRGYHLWLRTWLDDSRFVAPFLWSLDTDPIEIDDVPPWAFDSADEQTRVAALFDKYNHPDAKTSMTGSALPQANPTPQVSPNETNASASSKLARNANTETRNSNANANTNQSSEESGEENDESDNSAQPDQPEAHGPVAMTPEIDAGFAQLARERIGRSPFRFYVWLPIARAETLWFDTHSQYWPFDGELLPLSDLDYEHHQQIWLPLFSGLTAIYSLLGLLGGWLLWASRKFAARRWLLLTALIIFLRLGFFSFLENPEPRYVVEFFPFLSVLGGIAIAFLGTRTPSSALREKHS